MEELLQKLQGVLSTPEGQQQLQNIQSMLGGGSAAPAAPSGEEDAGGAPAGNGGGFDLSALANMLGGMNGGSPPPAQSQPPGGGFNLSALAGVLNGMASSGAAANPPVQAPAQTGGGPDLSALMGMLGGGAQNAGGPAPGLPNIDMNMILKLQTIFQKMNQTDDKDTRLLLALKPHFSQRRQSKVDQAMSMMRLFSMMPMLKEVFPL